MKEHRGVINELNFLLKQVQKEIKALRAKGNGADKVIDIGKLKGIFNMFF